MGSIVRLDGWAVIYEGDAYTAPELTSLVLIGTVTGHPRKPDGSYVRTSQVIAAEGRTVTTASGTQYLLGEPSPEYREYLRVERPNWDPENPVTVER